MESRPSSTRDTILSPFRYTSLFLILLAVSGCGGIPNLIPYGYGDAFDDKARASTVAESGLPNSSLAKSK